MTRSVAAILAVALLLAIGMASLGFLASRALRDRDRAVRDGILLGVARELEAALRQTGPEAADAALRDLLARKPDAVIGAEILAGDAVVARAGALEGEPSVDMAALGPAWRGMGGMREGARTRGRGMSPFTLRLYPSPALGGNRAMARAVMTGTAVAAAALFALALLAARGLSERERRLEAEGERRRLELAATAGAALAHRIRTPLGTIKGTAQLLESERMFSLERARRIVDESARIDAMIRRLLEFARPAEPQREGFDVAERARQVASRFDGTRVDAGDALLAMADPAHYEIALEELVTNARAFDPGEIRVSVRRERDAIVTEVRDHGPGLSIEPSAAVEPYVSTRVDGTGLGLAIVQTLARANGGTLELRNADGGGCLATLRLQEAS